MLVELGLVEQRYKAVSEVLVDGATVTEVALRLGVSTGRRAPPRETFLCAAWLSVCADISSVVCRGGKGANMPPVQVNMAVGRTDEQKRALLSAITEAVQTSIGAPLASIRV
jgi:tautomerase-like protein